MFYKDFVDCWKAGKEQWDIYRIEVGNVAAKLCCYFAEKMGFEKDKYEKYLKLFPLKENDHEKIQRTIYAPCDCVDFDEFGWANVGLRFLLEYGENCWPKNQFIFTITIKRKGGGWLLKIASDGTLHTLSAMLTDADLESVWDEFVELFKHQTVDQLSAWLSQDKK